MSGSFDPLATSRKGFISPADFIPFAERTGQIVSIGEWVLRQACEEVKAWNMQHETQISVAVNLSPYSLKEVDSSVIFSNSGGN